MKHQIIPIIRFTFLLLLLSANHLKADHNEALYAAATANKDTEDVKTDRAAKVRSILIGKWENPFFAVEYQRTRGGSLRYHFRDNGTYTMTIGGAESRIEQEGRWEVSEDGKRLLLHSRSFCNGQEVAVTQMAAIKHLQFDELVLEQTICVDGVMINNEAKDLYFNRY